MMTSRVLSRFLPAAEGDVSVFETLRNEPRRRSDVESQPAPLSEASFHDYGDDPEQLLFDGVDGAASNVTFHSPEARAPSQFSPILNRIRPKWLEHGRNRRIEEDDDVPESLLFDPNTRRQTARPTVEPSQSDSRERDEARWRSAQEQHRLQLGTQTRLSASEPPSADKNARVVVGPSDPAAEAMWTYTNAHNLDAFLLEIYQYYVEHGVYSILLSRAVSLLAELFVFSFAVFLTTCIDYSKIPSSRATAEVTIPRCLSKASWIKSAAIFVFVIYWLSRLVQHVSAIPRLFRIHNFYLHVLGINDKDIQTVSWVRVVDGLVRVKNANVATAEPTSNARRFLHHDKPVQRLNAESIANRLLRQDNYYVALYNKDIFDFSLPLPFVGSRQFYSKSLEWCIDFCLTNFIFDEQGSIRPFCLDVKNRKALVNALQRRLQFTALTSVLIAPFNIIRFCITYFFRYYTEFTRNPSRLSARTFTPFAEWKIREFNELDHLFQRRLRQAFPFANDYLKQFPKDKTDQVCRFVALISGAIAAVLALLTLWDPELFLGFEVTPGRTAVFYLTVTVGIFGVAHGSLPDENEVHDPVLHLKEVLMFTHYMPAHWRDRLHSTEVLSEFSAMYQMKILIFVEEILSLLFAPWILLRNASPTRSARIIDFFREQTVHVEGIGYQCNFAVFGFKKDLNAEDPTTVLHEPDGLRDDYYGLKDDKMAASRQNFARYYSHFTHRQGVRRAQGWQPPPSWPPVLEMDAENVAAASTVHLRTDRGKDRAFASASPEARRQKQQGDTRPAGVASEPPVSESRLMAQDSDLHDFNMSGGQDVLESDDDGDGEVDGGGALGGRDLARNNVGVLGMLVQFSKAQAEKGVGVG